MPPTLLEILQTAWDRRETLRRRTGAFRLLNGAASGTPGLAVDMFSPYLVVYAYDSGLAARYPGLAGALEQVTGALGASLKDRTAADESGREAGADLFGTVPEIWETEEGLGPAPEAGKEAPDPAAAGSASREGLSGPAARAPSSPQGGPLRFAIHLRHPRNVGLFLDTRPLRDILRSSCRGASVLNLFAYSCSLGAAAAAGSAASVANVDISARYLGWGRENFRLSGLPAEGARFTRMDSEEYLDWAARKGHGYDVVILDPPSFSRARLAPAAVKTFAFEKDYFRLLGKAAARLNPGGRLYAVTNFGGITAGRFREGVEAALRAAGRKQASLRPIGLPMDFDPGPDGLPKPVSDPSRQEAREGAFLALEATVF